MKRYVYRDNRAGRKVVFACVAYSITHADILYTGETGNEPVKQPYVGCAILPLGKVVTIYVWLIQSLGKLFKRWLHA